jgi:flagellin
VIMQIGVQSFEEIPVIGFDGQAEMGTAVSDFAAMGGSGGTVDVGQIDAALEAVRGYRSEMGAVSNRFAAASDMLSVERENLMAAESRIRDADMALEISNLAAAQIRSQASISALAMSNRNSSQLLALLN